MPSILQLPDKQRDTRLLRHLHRRGEMALSMGGLFWMLRTRLIKLGMMSRPLMIRVAAATHHTQQRESCRGAGRRKRLGCSGGRKLKVPLRIQSLSLRLPELASAKRRLLSAFWGPKQLVQAPHRKLETRPCWPGCSSPVRPPKSAVGTSAPRRWASKRRETPRAVKAPVTKASFPQLWALATPGEVARSAERNDIEPSK